MVSQETIDRIQANTNKRRKDLRKRVRPQITINKTLGLPNSACCGIRRKLNKRVGFIVGQVI